MKLKNEKETIKFAEQFAQKLKGGEIIVLSGDLGSGKTIFTKGIAKALGVKEHITSPTFIVMRLYKIKGHKKIKTLAHIDCYRLDSDQELLDIGIEEYLNVSDTVCVIEWGERLKFLKKYKTIKARFELGKNKNERNIKGLLPNTQ